LNPPLQDTKTLSDLIDNLEFALQNDLEHGVKWLNEEAAQEFVRKYPNVNDAIADILEWATLNDL
jgi:hypothetical protein